MGTSPKRIHVKYPRRFTVPAAKSVNRNGFLSPSLPGNGRLVDAALYSYAPVQMAHSKEPSIRCPACQAVQTDF